LKTLQSNSDLISNLSLIDHFLAEPADILSVTIVTVNWWENNKFEPTIKIKRKLQALFKENVITTGEEEK
jgi:hypothetical protein